MARQIEERAQKDGLVVERQRYHQQMINEELGPDENRSLPHATELLFRFVERSLASAAVIIAGLALGTQPSVHGGFLEALDIRIGALTAIFGMLLYGANFIATIQQTRRLGVQRFTLFGILVLLLLVTSTLVSVSFRIQQGEIKFPLRAKVEQAR